MYQVMQGVFDVAQVFIFFISDLYFGPLAEYTLQLVLRRGFADYQTVLSKLNMMYFNCVGSL